MTKEWPLVPFAAPPAFAMWPAVPATAPAADLSRQRVMPVAGMADSCSTTGCGVSVKGASERAALA